MNMKPLIFISHANQDIKIVELLKSQIEEIFANGVEVYASSISGMINIGINWFENIREKINQAQAVVFLITPASIERPWIWFEMGASWSRYSEGKAEIYPLICGLDLKQLPEPLNLLQALSLHDTQKVRVFFEELCQKFGFGNLKTFSPDLFSSILCDFSSEYQINLEGVLEKLIDSDVLAEKDIDIFGVCRLLPVDKVRRLKKIISERETR